MDGKVTGIQVKTDMVPLHADFLAHLLALGRSAATLSAYRSDFKTFITYLRGSEVGLFTSEKILQYSLWLSRQGRTSATVNRHLAGLTAFGDWMMDRDYVYNNPAARLARPRIKKRLPRPVPTDFANYLTSKTPIRDRAVFALMRYAGLRVNEVCSLDLADVYPTHIRIRCGKGGIDASIPTSEKLCFILSDWIEERGTTPGSLFPGKNTPRLTPRRVREFLDDACRQTGEHYGPHQLRHTFGTELIRAQVPLPHAQRLMRHSNPTTTMGYVLIEASDLTEAMKKADAQWRQP